MAQFLKFKVMNGNSITAGGDYTRDVLVLVDDIESVEDISSGGVTQAIVTLKGAGGKILTLSTSTSATSVAAVTPVSVSQNTPSQIITRAMSANPGGTSASCQLGIDGDGNRSTASQMYWSSAVFSVAGSSSFPTFTTDLDTEIQVGTVDEGGVVKDLFYKRFLLNVLFGDSVVQTILTLIPNIIKVNTIIQEPGGGPGQFANVNIFARDPAAYTMFLPDEKGSTIIAAVPAASGGATFTQDYAITFELWYTK